jgi:ADP-ribose pyrophosphatase YjhB (NUDIX family)
MSNDWLNKLPKKSLAVKLILKSDKDNVLLVKPTYKKAWQLPGGGVELNEDPKQAVVREISEETGIKLDLNRLQLLDSVFRADYDNLILIYEYQNRVAENIQIVLQESELEGYKFTALNNVSLEISDYYSDFFQHYLSSK